MKNEGVLVLTFDDGTEKECDILFTYFSEISQKKYVFIQDQKIKQDQVGVLEFIETGDGNGKIIPISPEDDVWDELEEVFESYLDNLDDEDPCENCVGSLGEECNGCDGCDK